MTFLKIGYTIASMIHNKQFTNHHWNHVWFLLFAWLTNWISGQIFKVAECWGFFFRVNYIPPPPHNKTWVCFHLHVYIVQLSTLKLVLVLTPMFWIWFKKKNNYNMSKVFLYKSAMVDKPLFFQNVIMIGFRFFFFSCNTFQWGNALPL